MIHRNISPGVEMCGDNTGTACASVSKTNKDSVTGSQYFVTRECRNNIIILSRVPDSRQYRQGVLGSDEKQKSLLKNELKLIFRWSSLK